jgi:hypothetical protein
MGLKKVCAWCQTEMGEIDCLVSGVTHGICPDCAKKMRTGPVLRKEHLEAGLTLEEDDHVIQVKKQGQPVARFTAQADIGTILEKADEYLR